MNRILKISFIGLAAALMMIVLPLSTAFAATKKVGKISVTSLAFKNNKMIPVKYAHLEAVPGLSKNISIPLQWTLGTKDEANVKSFAITMIDNHKMADKFVHWFEINIDPLQRNVDELMPNVEEEVLSAFMKNSFGENWYGGPNPPAGSGKHTYAITVYALNVESLEADSAKMYTAKEIAKLLKGKIVAKGTLKGKFEVKGAPSAAQQSSTVDVQISAEGFSPTAVSLKKSDTVRFTNKDSAQHWPASNVHPTHTAYPEEGGCIGSAFDSCGGLATDQSFSFKLTKSGSWSYHDHMNPSLTGTVNVE